MVARLYDGEPADEPGVTVGECGSVLADAAVLVDELRTPD
jgi:hypothetical protein